MSSNYPPGVTGQEYEIAGPDTETESREYCQWCASPQDGYTMTYSYQRWFSCLTCDQQTDMENLPEPEYLQHAGEDDDA